MKKMMRTMMMAALVMMALYGGYTLHMKVAETKAEAIADNYRRVMSEDDKLVDGSVRVVKHFDGYSVEINQLRDETVRGLTMTNNTIDVNAVDIAKNR